MFQTQIDVKKHLADGTTIDETLTIRWLESYELDSYYEFVKNQREKMDRKDLFLLEDIGDFLKPFIQGGLIYGIFDPEGQMVGARYVAFCKQGHPLQELIHIPEEDHHRVVHFKSTMIDPAYRGNQLQFKTGLMALEYSNALFYDKAITTIAPDNNESLHNMLELGLTIRGLEQPFDHEEAKDWWRYILYRDGHGEEGEAKEEVWVDREDYETQQALFRKGYRCKLVEENRLLLYLVS